MKTFNEMSLKSIRLELEKVGVEMSDERFSALSHRELKKVYKKSKKAYELYKQVDAIIDKKKAPTPKVPMRTNEAERNEKTAEGKNKIIKGA